MGQHAVKAGVRFERIGNDRLSGQVEPTITFFWDQTHASSTGVESRGPYGYYRVTNNVLSTGDIHSDNWGFFLQDAWSPTARLTINAGVRMESEQIPFYTPGAESDGIEFGFGDESAPDRLHLGHQGRRALEGLRLPGAVLRRDEVRDAARLLRRRQVAPVLLDARHARLEEHQLSGRHDRLPGPAPRGLDAAVRVERSRQPRDGRRHVEVLR